MVDEALATKFFEVLFGASWAPLSLPVVSFPRKGGARVSWSGAAADAARVASSVAVAQDVYLGCCLRRADASTVLGGSHYGTAEDVVLVPGVYLDIDMASPYRKGAKPLPESVDEAMDIYSSAFDLPPSLVVESGFGLQPWWLIRPPLRVLRPEQRAEAALLSEAWYQKARNAARRLKFELDAKQSLATVLRIPGTLNHKGAAVGDVRPVGMTLGKGGGLLYTIDQLFDACAETVGTARASIAEREQRTNKSAAVVDGVVEGLRVRADADPPAELFAALLEADEKFALTWKRQRPDLKDQSQSGYDLSLAVFACAVGWSDQEVTDLLVAHRRADGREPALVRHYARTLLKARRTVEDRGEKHGRAFAAAEEKKEAADLAVAVCAAEALGEAALLALLRERLDLPVEGFLQRGRDPALFYLLVEPNGREIRIGSAKAVLAAKSFREAVLEALGVLLPRMKQPAWEELVHALFVIRRIEEIAENDRARETIDWIAAHVENCAPLRVRAVEETDADWRDEFKLKRPFFDEADGLVYFNTGGLLTYLKLQDFVVLTAQELRVRLSEVGIKSVEMSVRVDQTVLRRSYWAIQRGLVMTESAQLTLVVANDQGV